MLLLRKHCVVLSHIKRLFNFSVLIHSSIRSSSVNGISASAMSQSSRPILVVGSANYDITSYTSTLPTLGETVLGEQVDLSCGGKGANQAKAAACIARSNVHWVGRVGNDMFGKAILQNLQRFGVFFDNESATVKSSEKAVRTGVASIIVDTLRSGDNMIVVTPGANQLLSPLDVRTAVRSIVPNNTSPSAISSIVLIQMEIAKEATLEAIKMGRECNSLVIVNPAPVPDRATINELDRYFSMIDILIPNESELLKLYRYLVDGKDTVDTEQDMARFLLNRGIRRAVIVTLGARGAMVMEKSHDLFKVTYVEAPLDLSCLREPIVDTVGAGDAFCGAFAAYVAASSAAESADLSNLAIMACGYATLSTRRRGADYPKADAVPKSLMIPTLSSVDEKTVLTFVTGNKKKLEEVRQILSASDDTTSFPYEIVNQKLDLPELQGADAILIAKEKCRIAAQTVIGPCFIEDTSLCFNALNGMPGPYIKWFLDKCGHDGLNAMLVGFDDRSAYAQTIIAYTDGSPEDEIFVFDGRTDGRIVPPRGSLDFGWDPVFEPLEGGGHTYAEMNKNTKNMISHRSRSFAKFRKFLSDRNTR
jgi:ribokinase/non-canonical purine NTP pyrophosphatase (RdgB/HAM1 family)